MIISQTPLRLSLLGGNTDFSKFFNKYGGCVLSTAINKYVYCIVTKRFDNKIYVNWSKKEIVDRVNQIEHELVREALRKVRIDRGIEITFLSDIPAEGSGLGSSSAVTVGVLNALYHLSNVNPSAEKLAREAVDIEVNILKKPIGIQDQYACAFGGLRFYKFSRTKVTSAILGINDGLLEDLDNSLMLFYTGRTRKSGAILTGLNGSLKDKAKIKLNLKTKKLAQSGYRAVATGRIDKLGELLGQAWGIKKQMAAGITDPEIDAMYARAVNAGAIGGKIAGAGGGGFMMLVVPWENRVAVRKALKKYREVPFRLEPEGSKIIFNYRNN